MTDPVALPTLAADVEARLKALEVAAVAKEHAVVTWVKANFLHFMNMGGIAYLVAAAKHLL
jgi:hypothetical protein